MDIIRIWYVPDLLVNLTFPVQCSASGHYLDLNVSLVPMKNSWVVTEIQIWMLTSFSQRNNFLKELKSWTAYFSTRIEVKSRD